MSYKMGRLPEPSYSSDTFSTLYTQKPADAEAQWEDPETEERLYIRCSIGYKMGDGISQEMLDHHYAGGGTESSPFLVDFLPNDSQDPMAFSALRKWFITFVQALATLVVAFGSSAYSADLSDIMEEFNVTVEIAIMGVSFFVLGFALGPLVWAPLSEMYGRRWLFFFTYMGLVGFSGGCAFAPNMVSLVILRFLAGAFGSSPMSNAGGVIADMFPPQERGVAASLFAIAPFLGPCIGPIAGGFIGEAEGWRWVEGLLAIFAGVVWLINSLSYSESYTPVLLRKRAKALSKRTGRTYISKLEEGKPPKTLGQQYKTALSRPLTFLVKEPIVLLTSIYLAILYGTMYACFPAFPIIFQTERGWSRGVGGLAFIGLSVGMTLAVVINIFDNKRYVRFIVAHGGVAPPEVRLPVAMIGSVLVPSGLFWFAWTSDSDIHWIVPIAGSGVFGMGIVLVFLSLMTYLIDVYTVYAASALAASTVLRSLFGSAFPLFTRNMYAALGIHWATSIPAFMALACVPFPFLFFHYGDRIRAKCKYASEAAAIMRIMSAPQRPAAEDQSVGREK